jgi:hypothetical protein
MLLRVFFLVSQVIGLFFTFTCFGQITSSAPICTPSALDVYASPPSVAAESPDWHLFALEFKNIGTTACTAPGPAIDLLPTSDTNNNPYFAANGLDRAAHNSEFGEKRLAPGDWVHLFVGWVSRGAPEIPCDQYSGLRLRLLFHPNQDIPDEPSIEVRHLWIRACFHVFVSGFRPGRVNPASHPPGRWWRWDVGDRSNIVPTFPDLITFSQILDDSIPLKLYSPSKRAILGAGLQLRLEFPRQADGGCAFRVLRKRESSGATVILLQACTEAKETPATPGAPGIIRQGRLDLVTQNLDIAPLRQGALQYDVIAQSTDDNVPVYAKAEARLVAVDGTAPKQATVESPLPACVLSQLKIIALPSLLAEQTKTLRVYEAANLSTRPCSVAGVPDLKFLDDKHNDMFPIARRRCPNCVNGLYAPRPNGRIDLQPGEAAHFLVGSTAPDYETDPLAACNAIENLKLALPSEGATLTLPFAARICADVDVSAWRQAAFDHDPLNERWTSAHAAEISSLANPVPPDCNKPELLKKGPPRMIQSTGNLNIGWSMASHDFAVGQEAPIYFWLDNPGESNVSTSSCAIDHLRAYRFDLYDAYGHRVLSKQENRLREQCKKNPTLLGDWNCEMNIVVTISPHSCSTRGAAILTEIYDLPVGEYTVHPRQHVQPAGSESFCHTADAEPLHRDARTDITFSIH